MIIWWTVPESGAIEAGEMEEEDIEEEEGGEEGEECRWLPLALV